MTGVVIPISSCPNCKPNRWTQLGPSKGHYHCANCGKTIYKILKRSKQNADKYTNGATPTGISS